MVNIDGIVGIVTVGDGATKTVRLDRTGALVNTQAHCEYAEPGNRGVIMVASNAVAGVAPGTALSTTPPICVWNPPNSGVILSIMKTAVGYVSGTLGAGSIVYAFVAAQTTVPSTGTELTPVCTKLGFPRGLGRAFTGSTIIAAGTILRPAFGMGAFLATTAIQPFQCADMVEGAISIPPGAIFIMQGIAAAGTTPLVILSIEWEEIPV
jgi:hypothetical protein